MNRAQPIAQSMHDFMDNEDGLLGEILITKEDFDTFGKHFHSQKDKFAANESHGSAIPGPIPAEMIVSSSRPMGIKLLQQMGWKEGQGIGNRKKRRMRDGKDLQLDLEDIKGLPAEALSGGEILFSAVDEVSGKLSEIPKPKVDKYGIGFNQSNQGYLGIGGSQAMTSFNRWNTPSSLSSSIDTKVGSGSYRVGDIFSNTSSGFENNNLAVGKLSRSIDRDNGGFALDDDEDDVYENSHTSVDYSQISTYSQPISKLHNEVQLSFQEKQVPLLTMSADATGAIVPVQLRCKTDNKLPLRGFHVSEQYLHCTSATASSKKEQSREFQMIYFPPPVVPRDFKEKHDFLKDRFLQSVQEEPSDVKQTEGMAEAKPLLKGRLYDMLDARGKEQINRALALQSNSSEITPRPSLPLENESPVIPNPPQPFAASGLAEALKGRFMSSSASKSTIPAGLSAPQGGLVTAQDLEQERKLKAENELKLNPPKNQSQGGLLLKSIRRITTTWAPNRLLCKRMNVPVPQITTDKFSMTSQVISNPGREAEIFEKHIEKHISSNSFLQLPSDASETLVPDGKQESSSGGEGVKKATTGVSGSEGVFHLEENIDPTTGIFIPEIKPQLSLLKSIFDESESESESEAEEEELEEKVASPPQITPEIFPGVEAKPVSAPLPLSEIQPKPKDQELQQVRDPEKDEERIPNLPSQQEDDTKVIFRKPTSRGMTRSRVGGSTQSKSKPTIISLDFDGEGDDAGDFKVSDLRILKEDTLRSTKNTRVTSAPSVALTPSESTPTQQQISLPDPSSTTAVPNIPKENLMRTTFSHHSIQSNQKTLERLKRSLETEQPTTGTPGIEVRDDKEREKSEEEERKRRKKSKKKSKKSKKDHKSSKKKKKVSKSERGDRRGSRGSSSSSSDSDDSS